MLDTITNLNWVSLISVLWIWVLAFSGFYLVRKILAITVNKLHKDITNKQNKILKDVLKNTFNVFLITFYATYITSLFYDSAWKYYDNIQKVSLIIIIALFFRLFAETVEFFENLYIYKMNSVGGKAKIAIIRLISTFIKVIVFAILTLYILKLLGVDISTLLAGFGIGGIALAFGLQSILGDFFASIALHFDHPFAIGDYIEVGTDSGTVKDIGIKTTKLQTVIGDELVISNTDLASARIRNFGKMRERRVKLPLTITYGTDMKALNKVKKIVKNIIDDTENTQFNRIYLTNLGDYSINFEAIYYINSREYVDSLIARDNVNFAILKEFAKNDIELAYPTQTVVVQKEG